MNILRSHLKQFFLLTLLFSFNFICAQEVFRVAEKSEFKVSGTSTLHDWEMSSSEGGGTATFELENGDVENIRALHVTLEAKTLKSGKSGMDKNAYNTLKIEENPFIEFKMDRVIAINEDRMKLKGEFSAGGTAKTEVVEVKVNRNDDRVILTGSFDMSFSEYNMEPPSFMGGTISTGDELTISFITIFKN